MVSRQQSDSGDAAVCDIGRARGAGCIDISTHHDVAGVCFKEQIIPPIGRWATRDINYSILSGGTDNNRGKAFLHLIERGRIDTHAASSRATNFNRCCGINRTHGQCASSRLGNGRFKINIPTGPSSGSCLEEDVVAGCDSSIEVADNGITLYFNKSTGHRTIQENILVGNHPTLIGHCIDVDRAGTGVQGIQSHCTCSVVAVGSHAICQSNASIGVTGVDTGTIRHGDSGLARIAMRRDGTRIVGSGAEGTVQEDAFVKQNGAAGLESEITRREIDSGIDKGFHRDIVIGLHGEVIARQHGNDVCRTDNPVGIRLCAEKGLVRIATQLKGEKVSRAGGRTTDVRIAGAGGKNAGCVVEGHSGTELVVRIHRGEIRPVAQGGILFQFGHLCGRERKIRRIQAHEEDFAAVWRAVCIPVRERRADSKNFTAAGQGDRGSEGVVIIKYNRSGGGIDCLLEGGIHSQRHERKDGHRPLVCPAPVSSRGTNRQDRGVGIECDTGPESIAGGKGQSGRTSVYRVFLIKQECRRVQAEDINGADAPRIAGLADNQDTTCVVESNRPSEKVVAGQARDIGAVERYLQNRIGEQVGRVKFEYVGRATIRATHVRSGCAKGNDVAESVDGYAAAKIIPGRNGKTGHRAVGNQLDQCGILGEVARVNGEYISRTGTEAAGVIPGRADNKYVTNRIQGHGATKAVASAQR